jgi:transposase InsO family protein
LTLKNYLFKDRREEKKRSNRRRRRRRRRRKENTVRMHQKTVHLLQRIKKSFPLGRFQFSVPPLPSGKCGELVSEEEKLCKFYLNV